MARDILVSAQDLHRIQKESKCEVVDCRFVLNRPEAGYKAYLKGHIPGALNYPCDRNLSEDGLFKKMDEVRNSLLKLAGDPAAQNLVHMCDSGVTACQNIFAAELTGFNESKLYVGSWSEWIRDTSRPIES